MRLEDIIDILVDEIKDKIDVIERKYPDKKDENNKLGVIGEVFVNRGMKHCLLNMGFTRSMEPISHSFWITPQYKADKIKKQGGIDYLLRITDNANKDAIFLVESKNWNKYKDGISPDTFEKKIYSRFKECDPNHKWIWVVTMNKDNYQSIAEYCEGLEINVLRIDSQIKDNIKIKDLRRILKSFVKELSDMMIYFFGDDVKKEYVLGTKDYVSALEGIKDYIRHGVPDSITASAFKREVRYVENVKSKMKKNGELAVDRKRKESRALWEY